MSNNDILQRIINDTKPNDTTNDIECVDYLDIIHPEGMVDDTQFSSMLSDAIRRLGSDHA